jgi:hypothetical protein
LRQLTLETPASVTSGLVHSSVRPLLLVRPTLCPLVHPLDKWRSNIGNIGSKSPEFSRETTLVGAWFEMGNDIARDRISDCGFDDYGAV